MVLILVRTLGSDFLFRGYGFPLRQALMGAVEDSGFRGWGMVE